MGKLLDMLQQQPALPVDPQWRCQNAGDCCEKIAEVVMTKEEASVLVYHAPPTVKMEFRPVEGNFVAMKAGPCPLHIFDRCTVYEHRPYNCRRFGCMRPEPGKEPFRPDGGNMMIRVMQSKPAAKLARYMQKRAMPWAQAHGWNVKV